MCTQNKKDALMTKMEEINLRDQLAHVYDEQISEYQHLVEVASAIKKLDPLPDEVILDIGCGTGRFACKLLEMDCNVVGLDFSGESLMICKSRYGEPNHCKGDICLIRADACSLPLKDNFFDKCISSEVLEHIPSEVERSKMIQEAYRVLKPNGKLVLTTYNHSLRKIIGRKKVTAENAPLYAYRYNYFELKKTISHVFKDEIKIVGILNLRHWIPNTLLNKFKKPFVTIDNFIEKTPLSYLLAHLLLVECKKSDLGGEDYEIYLEFCIE